MSQSPLVSPLANELLQPAMFYLRWSRHRRSVPLSFVSVFSMVVFSFVVFVMDYWVRGVSGDMTCGQRLQMPKSG
jgi:hypothetical protein